MAIFQQVLFTAAVLLAAADLGVGGRLSYRRTGRCQATLQGVANIYNYHSTQSQFDGDNKETTDISARVTIFCISSGRLGNQKGQLFGMKISNTHAGGQLFEKDAADRALQAKLEGVDPDMQGRAMTSFDDDVVGWFSFFQTDGGDIPAVYHSKEADAGDVNFKKKICASMQANFKGTSSRKEADPTSSHISRYTNDASMEGVTEQGTVLQKRIIDSVDVSDYASHIEPDQVKIRSEDVIQYKQRVLLQVGGQSTFSILSEVHVPPGRDVEPDALEADTDSGERKRRQAYPSANARQTYDEGTKMNHFEATGSFTLKRVRQEQMVRTKRDAVDHLELPEVVESSLLAFINHTQVDLESMEEIRSELGNIPNTLQDLHESIDDENDDIAHKLRSLLELESKYGPLPGYTPALGDVLGYLQQLHHSETGKDIAMRASIYFMISSEGSLRSQLALFEALDSETSEEERLTVIMYIAFVHNPQPQLVARIEDRIGPDVHSNDPLLLAYGCLIARAYPELQQHMTLFLLKRLTHAQSDRQSLIHHLHSLGNAGAPGSAHTLISYLQHPDEDVQLTTISALRFLANNTVVQKAFSDLLLQPDISEEHLGSVISSLQYGMEHARENQLQKPYSSDLATALVIAAIDSSNGQFDSAIIKYLSAVNTPESKQLAHFLSSVPVQDSTNGTRTRRGTNWSAGDSVYNLVAPLRDRQSDKRIYQYRKSFIWGKKFGVSDGNIQFAAGGFMGVSNAGDYKVFAHAVAEGNAFGRTYRALDFKLLRQKTKTNTHSVLYVMVAGKTLKNINVWQPSSVCKKYDTGLFRKKTFHLFTLRHSMYIYVGTLSFKVEGSIEMTGTAFMQFCENRGSATATVGLTPTLTFKIRASASANILALAKGFIDVTGTFNYVVSPELSTVVCYKYGRVAVQNCAGIYHQWKDNNIRLKVSYQTRELCWGECWSKKKAWKAASKSWSVSGTRKTPLWEVCDQRVNC